MADSELSQRQEQLIDKLVAHYVANQGPIKRLPESMDGILSEWSPLAPPTPSGTNGVNDPAYPTDKLIWWVR